MMNRLKSVIESLIFISLEPLTIDKIKDVLEEFNPADIEKAVKELLETYNSNERGIQVLQSAGGFLLSTRSEYDPYVKRLLIRERRSKLSPAATETLSAIAYHQPTTLAEISALRGVDSSHTVKTLLQKKLIKIVGRKKAPGKPLLYRTTDKFLTYFGLDSLKELPTQEEIAALLEEDEVVDE